MLLLRFRSSRMLCSVAGLKFSDISKEHSAFSIRDKDEGTGFHRNIWKSWPVNTLLHPRRPESWSLHFLDDLEDGINQFLGVYLPLKTRPYPRGLESSVFSFFWPQNMYNFHCYSHVSATHRLIASNSTFQCSVLDWTWSNMTDDWYSHSCTTINMLCHYYLYGVSLFCHGLEHSGYIVLESCICQDIRWKIPYQPMWNIFLG